MIILENYYYIAFALLMASLALLFVPRKAIRSLFGLSLIWGYLGSLIFVKIFGPGILNWYMWIKDEPFVFIKSPFLLNLAWAPAIMIYLYFLPKRKHLRYIYWVTFALVSAGLDQVFHELGLLKYNFWNPFFRFIFALIWLYGATWHTEKLKILEKLPDETP